jgi:plastocyanin
MRPTRVGLVLFAALALLAAGCVREANFAPLEITAHDMAFEGAPRTIRGNGTIPVTFRNEGRATHELAFLDIGDASLETFAKEFPAIFEGKPFPSFLKSASVVGEIPPGDTLSATFSLPAGEYLLMCALDDAPGGSGDQQPTGKLHYELGMYQRVTVEGEGGELPEADGEIVARDYTFNVSGLKPGRNELVFRNEGPKQWHFADIMEFPVGVSEDDALKAFEAFAMAEEGAPPPADAPEPESVGFTGVYSPRRGGTFEVTLTTGRTYMLACFVSDMSGGPPHAFAHKMIKTFTVG